MLGETARMLTVYDASGIDGADGPLLADYKASHRTRSRSRSAEDAAGWEAQLVHRAAVHDLEAHHA